MFASIPDKNLAGKAGLAGSLVGLAGSAGMVSLVVWAGLELSKLVGAVTGRAEAAMRWVVEKG